MYSLDINTSNYDIRLIANTFGKKTHRTIKKTIKQTDILKMIKRVKKTFKNYNTDRLCIPL